MARLIQYLYSYPIISENGEYEEALTTFDLGENLLEKEENLEKKLISLGIQAEKGTKFIVNGNTGYIGKSGIFEIDNIIDITSFSIGEKEDKYPYKILVNMLFES